MKNSVFPIAIFSRFFANRFAKRTLDCEVIEKKYKELAI